MTSTEATAFDPRVLGSEAIVTTADEAEVLTLAPGEDMRILEPGDERTPMVIDSTMPPGGSPPLHRHPWATYEVVVAGTIRMQINGEEFDLGPGDYCYTPTDAPHSFLVTGDTEARVIGMTLPGSADFYRQLAGAMGSGPPDPEALANMAAEHGAALLGPPMSADR